MSDATEQSPIPHVTVVSDPSDSHRTKTIKELVSTEIIYVNLLNDIVEGYIKPLREEEVIPSRVISAIFSNVEPIFWFHCSFLSDLGSFLQTLNDESIMSDIFLKKFPYFKMYTQYCQNYDNAISSVQLQKKSNPSFAKFLQDAQSCERFKGSYISSYLILPIQRIPRYEMLLKEIIKSTPANHFDLPNLQLALEGVTNMAQEVDEACKKAENIQRIMDISRSTNIENLLTPTRQFIRQDNIRLSFKTYANNSICYLFNDLVVFTLIKKSRRDKLHTSHPIALTWTQKTDSPLSDPNEILFLTPTESYSMVFYENHLEQWLLSYSTLIESLERIGRIKKARSEYTMMEVDGILKLVTLGEEAYEPRGPVRDEMLKVKVKEKKSRTKVTQSFPGPASEADTDSPAAIKLQRLSLRHGDTIDLHNAESSLTNTKRPVSERPPVNTARELRRSFSITSNMKKALVELGWSSPLSAPVSPEPHPPLKRKSSSDDIVSLLPRSAPQKNKDRGYQTLRHKKSSSRDLKLERMDSSSNFRDQPVPHLTIDSFEQQGDSSSSSSSSSSASVLEVLQVNHAVNHPLPQKSFSPSSSSVPPPLLSPSFSKDSSGGSNASNASTSTSEKRQNLKKRLSLKFKKAILSPS